MAGLECRFKIISNMPKRITKQQNILGCVEIVKSHTFFHMFIPKPFCSCFIGDWSLIMGRGGSYTMGNRWSEMFAAPPPPLKTG